MYQELEQKLRALLKGKFSSLTISFNELNGPNYTTVKDYENTWREHPFEWVSEDEHQKALDNNSMWGLQYYPDTPVGFCAIAASSLEALLSHLDPAD